jgi:hypothetical protein
MVISKRKLAGLVILGFLLGASAATVFQTYADDARRERPSFRADLAANLHLTEDQKARLNVILDESRSQMVALSESFRPQYRQVKEQTRDRIRTILDPQQIATFNRMMEERDNRKKGH